MGLKVKTAAARTSDKEQRTGPSCRQHLFKEGHLTQHGNYKSAHCHGSLP